jgi:hypothetical protein
MEVENQFGSSLLLTWLKDDFRGWIVKKTIWCSLDMVVIQMWILVWKSNRQVHYPKINYYAYFVLYVFS